MKKTFLIPMIAVLGLASCGGYTSSAQPSSEASSEASSAASSSEASTSSSAVSVSSAPASSSEAPAITAIASITDGAKVDITATVGAVSTKGFVLTDGTASIYVFLDREVADVAKGDLVNVKGVAETYTGSSGSHGYIRISKDVIYAKTQGEGATVTPVAMTKEIADALPSQKAFTDYKLYTWNTTVGKSGSYTTYPFAGSSTLIEPTHTKTADAGTEGVYYTVTAYFIGYDISHGGFATFIPVSLEDGGGNVSFDYPAKVLGIGQEAQLSAKTSKTESDTYTWSSSNTGAATISDTGVILGVAAGKTMITVTSNTSGKSATMEVEVKNLPVGKVELTTATLAIGKTYGDGKVIYGGSRWDWKEITTLSGGSALQMRYSNANAFSSIVNLDALPAPIASIDFNFNTGKQVKTDELLYVSFGTSEQSGATSGTNVAFVSAGAPKTTIEPTSANATYLKIAHTSTSGAVYLDSIVIHFAGE